MSKYTVEIHGWVTVTAETPEQAWELVNAEVADPLYNALKPLGTNVGVEIMEPDDE